MTLTTGAIIEGKFNHGVLEGKADVSGGALDSFCVDEFAHVQGLTTDYLVPPFLPLLN
jgi:hypothetical protein